VSIVLMDCLRLRRCESFCGFLDGSDSDSDSDSDSFGFEVEVESSWVAAVGRPL